jgi:glycosyltransferase involved in cell wall biosynthesis
MRYKRIDVAIGAFTRNGLPLRVVGRGEDERRLRSLAGTNVQFLGQLSDADVARQYAGCKAFIFTSDEDFGIAPLEAMASGRPVLAFAAGGALETVVEGVTGAFYDEQTPESLNRCVVSTDYSLFDPVKIRNHALHFSPERFRDSIRNEIDQSLAVSVRTRDR